ncbi:glycosyltransferase family 4 protein [Lactococcus garvieae]
MAPLKRCSNTVSAKNITFLGRLPYEKVLELDAKSDIFVLMSRSEGFATAMLEAAMLENVVIATPTVGGARDIMPDQSYGFIIENNETALLQTLKNIIADKEEMRRIQKKVSKNVVENFTWEQSTDAFVKVFKELDEKK